MNTKAIVLYATISILSIFSFSVSAFVAGNHLEEAIQHADTAVRAPNGKTIAEHAEIAKTHAMAVKTGKTLSSPDNEHLQAGIMSLHQAIKKGKLGAEDSARKAASDALAHFKEISK